MRPEGPGNGRDGGDARGENKGRLGVTREAIARHRLAQFCQTTRLIDVVVLPEGLQKKGEYIPFMASKGRTM